MLTVRPANRLDTQQMADLLNDIIEEGGTTAMTTKVVADFLWDKMSASRGANAWHVAELEGEILGFQWVGPNPALPAEACDIATFVKMGQTGLGIGSKLFNATQNAADGLGYDWINATIRQDNDSGLTYYQSRGFRDYDLTEDVVLANGLRVNKVHKRFDLK